MVDNPNIQYGLVAFLPDSPHEILYFCGFHEFPSLGDISSVKNDLINDEDYGDDRFDIQIRYASNIEVEYVKWFNSDQTPQI